MTNDWFKRQLFGQKSARRLRLSDPQQLPLAGLWPSSPASSDLPPPPTETVKAYQRQRRRDEAAGTAAEPELRVDASVPVEVIAVPAPEVAGLTANAYDVSGEKVTYRLAQRPGAYVILKYVRPVIKRKDTATRSCSPAPPAVLERSLADVNLLAGLVVDKFRYHLPLYRQHQRLADAGIRLNRATLTQWVQRTAAVLEPIYYAQLSSILQSQVLTMDETPIKKGRQRQRKLHTGYFWPVYGDQDKSLFPMPPLVPSRWCGRWGASAGACSPTAMRSMRAMPRRSMAWSAPNSASSITRRRRVGNDSSPMPPCSPSGPNTPRWLFCWTELGARYVGLVQSLLASCRLQGVDPYVYLVDVLQRIDTHPAFDVHLLTPRLWKQLFAKNPLRSDLDRLRQ